MKRFIWMLIVAVIATAAVSSTVTAYLFRSWVSEMPVASYEEKNPAQLVNYSSAPFRSAVSERDDFVSVSGKVTPSVVNITAFRGSARVAGGSGVIISQDGFIITNNHVIEDGTYLEVTLNNKKELKAELIGTDPTTDLALLKVSTSNLQPMVFGDSDKVEVGEWVLAIGNPFNLASTVTAGIVSAKGRNINILSGSYSIESFIQTDAVVNPGNSGGALVNADGKLVGINTAIITETGGYEGYSFAIPSNLVRKVVSDLRNYGKVQRALLGVNILNVDSRLAKELDLPSVAGVLISGVNSGSSADEAGLQKGDVIISVNGVTTATIPELQEMVARYRPGDQIDVEYFRNGKRFKKYDLRLKGIDNRTSFQQGR
jgi:serine protease Do